jgi:deoxycytidylate deaminase
MQTIDFIENSLPNPIKKARKESRKSDHTKHKLGASIVKNGKIISSGFNHHRKTNPQIKAIGGCELKTVHAEMDSIFKLKNKELLKGSTVAVYREKKDGSLGCARPCPICMNFLRFYGVKKIIYTTETGIVVEYLKNSRDGAREFFDFVSKMD